VFFISGLWHGANWTFLLWGMMHGIVMVMERLLRGSSIRLPKPFKKGLTFSFVTFAWSLFRASSVSEALLLWKQLFCGGFGPLYQTIRNTFQEVIEVSLLYRMGLGPIMESYPWLILTVFVLLLMAACFCMRNTQEKVSAMKPSAGKLMVVVILMTWSILSLSEISEFLYFNF
jgi:alginate O-acetyltransferase complex protein AlgI